MTEAEIQGWITIAFGAITAVGILFNINRVISAERSAIEASAKAETSARQASDHAFAAVAAIGAVAINVEKIEVATNSMKDALVTAESGRAKLEGREEGRVEEVARQEASKENT